MRNRKLISILFTALFIVFITSSAFAGNITVVFNGQRMKMNARPISRGGLVFVPLRGIFEKLGTNVEFQKDKGKIVAIKGKKKIVLFIGNNIAKVNGFSKRILVAPFIKNGRTFVPLRFIGESMGCEVGWHPPTSTVFITSKGTTPAKKKSFLMRQMEAYLKTAPKPKKKKKDNKIRANIKSDIKKVEPVRESPAPKKNKDDDDDDDVEDGDIKDIKLDD